MKLKRRTYNSHAEKATHFWTGFLCFLLINTILIFGLWSSYGLLYVETQQEPFPDLGVIFWIIGFINILLLFYFFRTSYWISVGMLGAFIANELIWLALGARDLRTILMPFLMAIAYFSGT